MASARSLGHESRLTGSRAPCTAASFSSPPLRTRKPMTSGVSTTASPFAITLRSSPACCITYVSIAGGGGGGATAGKTIVAVKALR